VRADPAPATVSVPAPPAWVPIPTAPVTVTAPPFRTVRPAVPARPTTSAPPAVSVLASTTEVLVELTSWANVTFAALTVPPNWTVRSPRPPGPDPPPTTRTLPAPCIVSRPVGLVTVSFPTPVLVAPT
jgi:hypothetical protein